METAPSQSGSAPAGEPTNAAPAASTARDPPSLVPPEADGGNQEPRGTDDFGEAARNVSRGNLADDGAGGLATRAAALLDAGAADAWLTSQAGESSVSQVSQTAVPYEGATRRASDADAASTSPRVSTPAPGRLTSDASPRARVSSSPLTPAERAASDPTRIHALAARATSEMATLRGELRSERALAKTYAAELSRLRASAESRVAAGVAAVASAADSARGAAAVRADVIARATAAEGHAAAFYRRAMEAERVARVERDRNASLVAALNAAGAAAAAATRALVERAEKAEALVEALELRVSDAEARADEAVGIARAATRNAADTARVASLKTETLPSLPEGKENAGKRENRAFRRAVFAPSVGSKRETDPSASENAAPRLEETPKKTRPKTFTSAFAPPSESAARAASPGRRCAACAARADADASASAEVFPRSACVACDEKKASSSSRAIRLEVSVPTAAGAGAAWTGTLRSPDRVPVPARPARRSTQIFRSCRDAGDGDDERDEPDARDAAEAPDARDTAEARLTEARLASLEGRMALAAAELARDHSRAATVELPDALLQSYRDAPTETRAESGESPGAENRRRRRRERAEVAAKLDATEARLSAMRLEDARRAEAKAAEV
jgi:hypothetical protein